MAEATLTTIAMLFVCATALGSAAWLASPNPENPSPMLFAMRVVARAMVASALTTIGVLVFTAGGNFVLIILSLIVIAMLFNRASLARQDVLLAVLATSVRKGMPLERVLSGLAREYRWFGRRRILRLVAMLNQGVPLATALARIRGILPRHAIVAVRVGTETGRLAAALEAAANMRRRRVAVWSPLFGRLGLLVWTLTAAVSVACFWSIYLYPRFNMIRQDFDLSERMFWDFLMESVGTTPTMELAILLQAACLFGLFYGMLVFVGWLPLIVPVGPLRRPFDAPALLNNLALVADADQPLERGMSAMAEAYPRSWMRWRLWRASRLLSAGSSLGDALDRAHLVRGSSAALVRVAERAGNLPWALRTIADSAERRLIYRLQALAQILFPIAVIALGLMVAIMAFYCLVPLVQMIEAQSK